MWTTILSFVLPLLAKSKGFFLKNKWPIIVSALIALLLLLNVYQFNVNKETKKQLAVSEQNTKASLDSVRITKDKAGKDEADHLAFYVSKVSDLEKLNKDLAKEVKETKGKVQTIVKENLVVKTDTVTIPAESTVTDSTLQTAFNLDTIYNPGNFRKLKGFTHYDFSTKKSFAVITGDELGIAIVTGIKNLDKGKPEIFVRSDYPGFSVTDIKGAVLDPNLFKKSKTPLITAGITIGWVPVTYDWNKKLFDANYQRIGISAGLNLNIIRLFKK